MDSSMCSSAPDPEMWIIQGTLAWRIDGAIRVRSNVDPTFDHSWDPGGPGGTTTAPLFSRIHTSLISVWTAISRAQV
nr:Ycf68 [Ipomoea batatas]